MKALNRKNVFCGQGQFANQKFRQERENMKYSDFFTEKGIPRKVYALEAPEIGGILIEIGFSGPIVP